MIPSDLALPSRFTSFRPHQFETAVEVVSDSARFPMANAPTGAGKSLLGMTAAALTNGRTLYIVSTRALQDQVGKEFSDYGVADIRGANNYRCGEHHTGCDVGGEVGCVRRKEGGACPYAAAVRRARSARTVVTNYAYRLAAPDAIGQFDLLVLDEAHLVHDTLADHCSIALDRENIQRVLRAKLAETCDVDELVEWARTIAESASVAARTNQADRVVQTTAGTVMRLAALANRTDEWAADSTPEGYTVTPVWAGQYAEQALYRNTPKVMLMSATLLPEMRGYLGIDAAMSKWHELPSSFAARRRPFYFVRGGIPIRVDHRMDSGHWGMLVSRVDRFMEDRLAHRGLVHTRSYARQAEFVRESRHRDVLVAPKSWQLRAAVEKFKSQPPPRVLVSPSIEEGFDFAFDAARWQVLLKVPFVDTRSNLMKARAKDRTYANMLTAQTVIQVAGRVMRDSRDAGETAIFDDHWNWFRGAVKWPSWFRDSWVECESTPPQLTWE